MSVHVAPVGLALSRCCPKWTIDGIRIDTLPSIFRVLNPSRNHVQKDQCHGQNHKELGHGTFSWVSISTRRGWNHWFDITHPIRRDSVFGHRNSNGTVSFLVWEFRSLLCRILLYRDTSGIVWMRWLDCDACYR